MAVEDRIALINEMLAAHAGGIELLGLTGGVARIAYTGMCTGCPIKPLTTAATVAPALRALPEVHTVEVAGGRISEQAEARVAAALAATVGARWGLPCGAGKAG
jgi:Fe-S cluster biogenesis protein NfuA